MSVFSGPQRRGAMKLHRQKKREQALERQKHDKTKEKETTDEG